MFSFCNENLNLPNLCFDYSRRVKENDQKKKLAQEKGIKINLKRQVVIVLTMR